jgi:hypothetical protein
MRAPPPPCVPLLRSTVELAFVSTAKIRKKKHESHSELVGFWTFPIVWYSREHDVSETGSVSVLRFRWGEKTPTQLGPLKRANLNHWTK